MKNITRRLFCENLKNQLLLLQWPSPFVQLTKLTSWGNVIFLILLQQDKMEVVIYYWGLPAWGAVDWEFGDGWAESFISVISSSLPAVLCYSWHPRQLFPRKWTPRGDLTPAEDCVLGSSHCNTCLRQSACKDKRVILAHCLRGFITIALEPGVRQ